MKPLIALIFGVSLVFGQATPNLVFSLPVKTDTNVLYQIAPGDDTNYNYSYLAANWSRNEVYVTNETSLIVINTATNPWSVKKTISLPNPPRNGMLISSSGMIVVMSSAPGAYPSFFPTIAVVDPDAGTANTVWTSSEITDFGIYMCSINASFSNDGNTLYFVATGTVSGELYAINTKTWNITGSWTLDAGLSPVIAQVLPNGKLYVVGVAFTSSAPPTEIAVFNADMTPRAKIKLQTTAYSIGVASNGLVYAGNEDFTATTDQPTMVIDSESDQVVANFIFAAPAYFAWASPDTPWLVYGGYPAGFRSFNLTGGQTLTFTAQDQWSYGVIAHRQSDGTDEIGVLHENSLDVYQMSEPTIVAPKPVISVGGIVDGAAYLPTVSPGGLASVFGSGFAGGTASAAATPLPNSLVGTQVLVDGKSAPLLYLSPTQANFQIPAATAIGTAKVQVVWENTASNVETVTVAAASPAFFANNGTAIFTDLSGKLAGVSQNPIVNNQPYVGWGTGFGLTACSTLADGTPATDSPCTVLIQPALTIGNETAKILFAGLSPGFVGLYQVNFILPPASGQSTSSNSSTPASATVVTGTLTAGSASSTFQVLAEQ